MGGGRGWRVAQVTAAALVVAGGLGFGFVLTLGSAMMGGFNPSPDLRAAAELVLYAGLCCWAAAVLALAGACGLRPRWLHPLAAGAFALTAVLCYLAWQLWPLAYGLDEFALLGAALVVATPWWGPRRSAALRPATPR